MTTHFDVPQGMERRLVVRVLRYWRDLAGASRDYPARSELDPATIGDSWASCFLLDLTEDRNDPTIEVVGEALDALCGAPSRGTRASAIAPGTLLAHAAGRAGTVLSFEVPIVFGGEFRNREDEVLAYRGILAPLGANPHGLTHILGAANARVGPL